MNGAGRQEFTVSICFGRLLRFSLHHGRRMPSCTTEGISPTIHPSELLYPENEIGKGTPEPQAVSLEHPRNPSFECGARAALRLLTCVWW